MRIEFFHPCIPPTATAQQRRHLKSGATYQPPAVKKARATLQAIFETRRPDVRLSGPVTVSMSLTWPWRDSDGVHQSGVADWHWQRPDLDNLVKLILDVATKCGYWTDDGQVCDLQIRKFRGDMPGIAFLAMEVTE